LHPYIAKAELLALTFQDITHPDDFGSDSVNLDRLVRVMPAARFSPHQVARSRRS
jgi:hypothetical protein